MTLNITRSKVPHTCSFSSQGPKFHCVLLHVGGSVFQIIAIFDFAINYNVKFNLINVVRITAKTWIMKILEKPNQIL